MGARAVERAGTGRLIVFEGIIQQSWREGNDISCQKVLALRQGILLVGAGPA